jgi:outer membrane protein TolC
MLAPDAFAQSAVPLTIRQAVAIALEKNPLRKVELAGRKAAGANVREARSALLPQLTFTESALRGNDPVFAFGTRLRQTRFTAADFALNQLNFPAPIGNFATRFSGRWNLFDSFASWMNLSRAEKVDQAAGEKLVRADQETVFRALQAYFGLLLAMKQSELAEQALQTAQAIDGDAQNRLHAGLAVESDALGAQANRAARQQESIAARNAVSIAQAQLALALGETTDMVFQPVEEPGERPLPPIELTEAEKLALKQRPDLREIALEQVATTEGVRVAKAGFGPRINAFAQWEADNPTFLAGGGGNNWVGGLELQLDLFNGGQKAAQLARAKAMQEQVNALQDAAAQGTRLEVRKAYYDTETARQTIEVARAAIKEAEESLRIIRDRYSAGLATLTDLLRAEEAARHSRTSYWQAVYAYRTTYANLELAMGQLTAKSPVAQ